MEQVDYTKKLYNFIVRFVIAVVIIVGLVFYYRYAQNRDENIRQLQEDIRDQERQLGR
jgi:cell division protein FtsL